MKYNLKLSRSNEILQSVEIIMDFNLRAGDILQLQDKYHEIKHIIRPAIPWSSTRKPNYAPSEEELEKAIPTLIIGDSFPLI
jgi:hypothetical protein